MEYYLNLKVTRKLITSPFREDHKPTCGFYYSDKGVLYLHDFATNEHLDVFEVVKRKFKINYYQAIIRINHEKNKFNIDKVSLKKEKIFYTFTEIDNFDYFKKFRISNEILKLYKVKAVKTLYVNEAVSKKSTKTNPIFAYTFPSGHFKFYRPLTKNDDKWGGNSTINDVFGYYQLPQKSKIVFITSSAKDVMVLRSLGYNAVAFSSENISTKNEVAKVINNLKKRFEYVFVYMDNDSAGSKANQKISFDFRINKVQNPANTPKDISDYMAKYNIRKTHRMLKKLIIKELKDDFEAFIKFNSETHW